MDTGLKLEGLGLMNQTPNASRSRSKLFNCQAGVGCLDLQIRGRRLEGSLLMRNSTSHHQLTGVSVGVNKGSMLESEAAPSLREVVQKEVGWLYDFTKTRCDRRVIGSAVNSINSRKEFSSFLLHGFLFPLLTFISCHLLFFRLRKQRIVVDVAYYELSLLYYSLSQAESRGRRCGQSYIQVITAPAGKLTHIVATIRK